MCFANRDGCSIKWNNTLKALVILLKFGHIAKGNYIAEVWVGRGISNIYKDIPQCRLCSAIINKKLCFTFLSHLFPLPCGAGSTVPRERFDSSVIMPFSWCVVAVTLSI